LEANVDIATIGALVGLGKGVAEAIKAISGLFGTRDDRKIVTESPPKMAALQAALNQYQGRMRVLAEQLRQAESLTRMVPAWLEVANLLPVWRNASDLSQEDCRRLDGDFRRLVNDSLRDHFSGTFFRTEFGKLPGIPPKIDNLRDRLTTLDRTVASIPPGNIDGFRALWPSITTHFNDCRNAASDVLRLAEDVQGNLIKELAEAATVDLAVVGGS
jgi:hypothetical protein